eukprot:1921474-Amphidinium_carterae.1
MANLSSSSLQGRCADDATSLVTSCAASSRHNDMVLQYRLLRKAGSTTGNEKDARHAWANPIENSSMIILSVVATTELLIVEAASESTLDCPAPQ